MARFAPLLAPLLTSTPTAPQKSTESAKLKIESGSLYVLRSSDTVSAVSWGISPCKALPCCLGKRQLGVGLLPCGFLHGRHFIVEEVEVISRDPMLNFVPDRSSTFVSFQFEFPDGTRGCLRVDEVGNGFTVTSAELIDLSSHHPDAGTRRPFSVVDPNSAFRVHKIEKKWLVSSMGQGALSTSSLELEQVVEQQPLYDDALFHFDGEDAAEIELEPCCAPRHRLQWGLNRGIMVRPDVTGDVNQTFLLRPRAPYLVTDFIIHKAPEQARKRKALLGWVQRKLLEDDSKKASVLQRTGREECAPLEKRDGVYKPRFATEDVPIVHSFDTSLLSNYINLLAYIGQVIATTSTVMLAIGDQSGDDPLGAILLRYFLNSTLAGSFCVLWLVHNQHYTTLLFNFLLSRGYIMEITADVVSVKHLFVGGWFHYFFWVGVYFAAGWTYFFLYKGGISNYGTLWIFTANSGLFYFNLLKRIRAPFDPQLMPLTTFIKSFDSGLITETAVRRAAHFLATIRPVQACVSLANPPAYVYIGQSPASIGCCWGWGPFSRRVACIVLACLFLGFGVFAATEARLFYTSTNFDAIDTCVKQCHGLFATGDHNTSTDGTTVCERCLCLCAKTLKKLHELKRLCDRSLDVASCSADITCITAKSCSTLL